MQEPTPHLNKTEARAGSTPHVGRYVLAVSTTLAVIALALVVIL